MENIYTNNTYLHNNPDWHEADAGFKAGKILQLLQRNPVPLQTVAEIGCGSGQVLVEMAAHLDKHIRFKGFDISPQAIQIAAGKATSQLTFLQEDITLENDHFFDLLLVIDVIEHVEDYFHFLTRLAEKGRYTIFHIPLDMCVWSLFREQMLVEAKNRIGHIHNFTRVFIESVLTDKGFRIIDRMYTPPTFEHMTRKQKFVNAMRKLLFKISPEFCTKTLGGYSVLLLTENKASPLQITTNDPL